jgi:hypothetical protein
VSGCGSEPFCDEIALGTPITKLQRLSFTAIGTIQQKTLQGDCQPFKSGELGVVAVQAGARAPSCTPRDAYFCHVKLDDAGAVQCVQENCSD